MARIKWVDLAKGMTIILMVLGHSSIPRELSYWIYSFHMPFFFFISGCMTKWNDSSFLKFAYDKMHSLVHPFIYYSLLNLLFYPLYGKSSFLENLGNVILHGWHGLALWFIPVMYVSLLIVKAMSKAWKPFFAVAMLVLGIVLCAYGIILPWTLSTVPIACFFILIGEFSSNMILKISKQMKNIVLPLMIICLLLSLSISQFSRMDMAANQILPIIPTLLAAIVGIGAVIMFAVIIEEEHNYFIKMLLIVGKKTFIILAFSQVIIQILNLYLYEYTFLKYLLLIIVLILIDYIKALIPSCLRVVKLHRFKKK